MNKRIVIVVLLIMILAVPFAWVTGGVALGYHFILAYVTQLDPHSTSLGLRDYQVTIEAKPVEGIPKNASGLTYHPLRKTLFTVINQPPQIAELDTNGKLLRTIPLKGFADVEGISHQYDDYFFITDEWTQRVYRVQVQDTTDEIGIEGLPWLGWAFEGGNNVGFEGVSWDSDRKRLFVVKEKRPLRVFEVGGLEELLNAGTIGLSIGEWEPAAAARIMLNDLSSLTYHENTGHLFLLSDESRLLVEFDRSGNVFDLLVLRAGWHGLSKGIPQAEGVAIDGNGEIYILSEPNLFYRFFRTP